eukprot:CAMPEP_0194551298 /NCGR_PEP_ID=MMETSP0253-20130528/96144_1 /TAXON_ID=2966 /ORGANISM="Noctiluca scintillans" /LENGTH=785 /DNA_ID=CAMNT_0039398755 /DNA_START=1 /DNA_END=2356 /DNA_ORIENTATION=-
MASFFRLDYQTANVMAEIGCNHMGDKEVAKELLLLAKRAGADVAKFQKRNPKELLTEKQYNAPHPNARNSFGATYGEHRENLEFSVDVHRELKQYCDSIDLEYSCSVWDVTSAKEIISLGPKLIKVGSPSNQHWEMMTLLRDHYQGDVHISTGMTTKEEVEKIVHFWEGGQGDAKNRVVLYNCTSGYPVPFEDICLLDIQRMIHTYGQRVKAIGFSGHHLGISTDVAAYALGATWVERHFTKAIGFSGHHLGISTDVAAYALGATWVERHFTKDRTWKGTDHAASLEPTGLLKLCRDLKAVHSCMSFKATEILPLEMETRNKLKWGQYNKVAQEESARAPVERVSSPANPVLVHNKPMVMAEIGCNHKGDKEIAKELLTLAKEAGADYGKFQKRNPKEVLTEEQYNAPHPNLENSYGDNMGSTESPKEVLTEEQYNAPHPNVENSYGDTYGEHRENLELTVDDHRELQAHCNSIGLEYSCSVWDTTSARDIVSLNPKLIKVGSPSNQHWEMQMVLREEYAGDVHISTGMTTKEEVRNILEFWEAGKGDAKNRVVLYNCTSGYPVPFEDVCLLEMRTMQEEYGHRVKAIGFSGHHLGIAVDVAAHALGATWVERHFTKDRTWKGTDHSASLEPAGLGKLCRNLHNAWKCMSFKKQDILPIEAVQRGKLKWGEYNADMVSKLRPSELVSTILRGERPASQKEPIVQSIGPVVFRRPMVMAEIGCNHKGDKEIAKELLTLAKQAGADYGKFQKRNPKEVLTEEQYNAPHPNLENSYGDTYGEHRENLE